MGDGLDALIQVCDGWTEEREHWAGPMRLDHTAFQHSRVACGRDRFPDLLQALLDKLLAAAVVLVKKTKECFRASFL